MKTALYTIFRCTNYGAVLQAFALARTLRGMLGEDSVDVINHRMDPRDTHLLGKISNPATPWFQRWINRRKFAARYFRPDLFELRRTMTVRLIDEFIKPTPRVLVRPEELAALPQYSTVVVGSDQVWNPGLNADFGRNQYLATDLRDGQDRVAYAASFGVSRLPETCRGEYAAALRRFRRITVREETGAAICESLLSVRPSVVLDPTMLLTAEEWREAAMRGESAAEGSHIAAYWVRTVSQADVDSLAAFSRSRGVPVRLMSAGPLPKLDYPNEVVPFVDADPFAFVREIADSGAVVTDSFHGLQFATIFRRPFAALGDMSDPESNASRLVDFCRRYGLGGRVQDIGSFRNGEAPHVDVGELDAQALEADRIRSIGELRALVQC
jgi:hypothetical protein